jgi:hypothetical protein
MVSVDASEAYINITTPLTCAIRPFHTSALMSKPKGDAPNSGFKFQALNSASSDVVVVVVTVSLISFLLEDTSLTTTGDEGTKALQFACSIRRRQPKWHKKLMDSKRNISTNSRNFQTGR